MKGALGIPRGFFSSENTVLILGGIAEGKRDQVGDLNTIII